VRTGDRIRLDVSGRRLELLVGDDELQRRAGEWRPPPGLEEEHRGYRGLFLRSVLQADEGCDFDFC
jgi:dihydroxy-acid dehydratase